MKTLMELWCVLLDPFEGESRPADSRH
jgi:hypothetical protein